MRNILIPTDYHEDTLHAMELTWRNAAEERVKVVLLSLSSLPDSIMSLLFISDSQTINQRKQRSLLTEWELRKSLLDISIELRQHHQYGASAPIIRQIIERYQINSIIVPASIQRSDSPVYQEALESFRKVACKVTCMPEREVSFSVE